MKSTTFRIKHPALSVIGTLFLLFGLMFSTICYGQQEHTQENGLNATRTAPLFEGEFTFDVGYEFYRRDSTQARGLNFGFTACRKGFRLRGKLGFPVDNGVLRNSIQSIDLGYTCYYGNFSWTPFIGITNLQPIADDSPSNHLHFALGIDCDLFKGSWFSFRPGIRFDISNTLGFGIGAQLRFGTFSDNEVDNMGNMVF